MTDTEDTQLEQQLTARYEQLRAMNLTLDLTRGKPAAEQLDLSVALDGMLQGDFTTADGTDARNYGGLLGIPEARELGADLLDVPAEHVIAGGNSSLQLMYLAIDAAMHYGLPARGQPVPLRDRGTVKAICPVPGYDRHFTLSESFGIEMVSVPMTTMARTWMPSKPWCRDDPACNFIWCVPKYTIPPAAFTAANRRAHRATAALTPSPFFVLWDNAYAVHDLHFPPRTSDFGIRLRRRGGHRRPHHRFRVDLEDHLRGFRRRFRGGLPGDAATRWSNVCSS